MIHLDPDPNTSQNRRIYNDVHAERVRAHDKHRDKPGGSMEMKGWTAEDWIPVLVEEVGEVARVINDFRHSLVASVDYPRRLREELVQVAAMATAWIAAIDSLED